MITEILRIAGIYGANEPILYGTFQRQHIHRHAKR